MSYTTSLVYQGSNVWFGYLRQCNASSIIAKICSCPSLFCVESIENKKQCDIFEREMEKRQRVLEVLVQVNTSEEPQKGGASISEAPSLANYIRSNCPNLRFAGFMTIGSFESSHVVPNPDFDRLYNIRQEWAESIGETPEVVELSMGMSEDYLSAIEQGSTSVRVGSKIFGPRIYK
uniref:Ala_racemase_N domain-containing protein n=1 Tax=Heterorhabditis bacteriophora TaxID=37862 RepID=A0A1I7WMK9_HETBA